MVFSRRLRELREFVKHGEKKRMYEMRQTMRNFACGAVAVLMNLTGSRLMASQATCEGAAVNRKEVLASKNEFNIAYHLCSDPHTKLELNVTEKELDEDFRRIKAIGFTHVTLWAGSVLSEEIGNVSLMKLAVRKAGEHGLGCYIWFWTAGKPLMYGQPGWDSPPMVDRKGTEVKYMNIWDETWRSGFLRDYLRWLGKTFRVFPNVAGYVVDEPFGSWGRQTPVIGRVGMGLLFSPREYCGLLETEKERKVRLRLGPDQNLRYLIVADWRRGRRFPIAPTVENWRRELRSLALCRQNPLEVRVGKPERVR